MWQLRRLFIYCASFGESDLNRIHEVLHLLEAGDQHDGTAAPQESGKNPSLDAGSAQAKPHASLEVVHFTLGLRACVALAVMSWAVNRGQGCGLGGYGAVSSSKKP